MFKKHKNIIFQNIFNLERTDSDTDVLYHAEYLKENFFEVIGFLSKGIYLILRFYVEKILDKILKFNEFVVHFIS